MKGKKEVDMKGKKEVDMKGKKEESAYKLYKRCSRYEDMVLFFFFINLILLWLFFTFYFVTGYLEIHI
jgi:hypothetical protein